MCNSNSTQGCGFAFLYHMAVFHLRNCMEFLTKPLSNEKVVRPALIYSLFPNVPPTIYFGTPDERGKPGRVSTWNSPQEKVASEAGGRVEGAFQNGCTGAWLPTWSTSPMRESLSCPSFNWPSWPHNLMFHSWPLTLCLSPFHPPFLSVFLIPVQSPFFPKVCSFETLTWNNTYWLAYRECWATVPPLSSTHHDSPALLHTLPQPLPVLPSGETSLGAEEAAPVEDEHSDPQHCQADHWTFPLQDQQEWVTCLTSSLSSAPADRLWAGGNP